MHNLLSNTLCERKRDNHRDIEAIYSYMSSSTATENVTQVSTAECPCWFGEHWTSLTLTLSLSLIAISGQQYASTSRL